MKRLSLLFLLFPFCAQAEDFHISANVDADIYLDGRYCGKTPRVVDLSGVDAITLKHEYFETAEISRKRAVETRRKLMSTTSGDAPRNSFLLAEKTERSNEKSEDEPRQYTARNIRKGWGWILWMLPLESVVYASHTVFVLPSQASRYTVPYVAEEYEPNQLYVYMFPKQRTERDERLWQVSRFVLKNFKSDRAEFVDALHKMTGLSTERLTEILTANPTPDAAAGSVIKALSAF
mgnify:FL=1